ncbi:putative phosphatidylinositol 4-kinase alpha [Trypanosoma cruzi]|nr:putative phosphatidylinositol 4-kinase alpha [Trypanosoma cruzi]
MDEIPFPTWVRRSPVFAMTRVLGQHLLQQLQPTRVEPTGPVVVETTTTTTTTKRAATASSSPIRRKCGEVTPLNTRSLSNSEYFSPVRLFGLDEQNTGVFVDNVARLNETNTSSNEFGVQQRSCNSTGMRLGDVLSHPGVALLISLSQINELVSQKVGVTVKNAPALVSLMALAVEWRFLPYEYTKGFYSECASFYTLLMRQLGTTKVFPGVDVQGFVASLVFCGMLLLRGNGEGQKDGEKDGEETNDHASRRGHDAYISQSKGRNIDLAGFDGCIIDSIIISCIPSDIDECVENPIALGALNGLAHTTKSEPIFLSSQLLNHLQNLTDAFTNSSRRREPLHKRLLCYLMEAICCARGVNYTRMRNWLRAVLQPDYVLRGLMQKEDLHARVVAAMLTLLTVWIQDAVTTCTVKYKGAGDAQDDISSFFSREECTEADALLENVWSALQEAASRWEDLRKTNVKLYGGNVRIVVKNLLQAELVRAQCYRTISCMYQEQQVQQGDNTWTGSYLPSAEEEDLRLRVIGNIVKFLILPTSIFSFITAKASATRLRQDIAEQCVKVIALTTSAEGKAISLWKNVPTPSAVTKARYSHKYHINIDGIVRELIHRVLEVGTLGTFQATPLDEEGDEGRMAALCLQGLCATNSHVRSFAVTEVLDSVVRLSTVLQSVDAESSSTDKNASISSSRAAPRLAVCFEMMNRLLVSRHLSILKPLTCDALLRFGKVFWDTFEDTLRVHVRSGDLANPTIKFPSATLLTVLESFWGLVQRCHERIRVMTREGLRLVASGDGEAKARLVEAFNAESRVLRVLLRTLLRCMINVAWPGSGILYGKASERGTHHPAVFDVQRIAVEVLSLFLRPLCLLCQLSTLFPVTDIRHLVYHHENAQKLTQLDEGESFLYHYCFQPSNINSSFYAENGMAQFRSCWLMLSYYHLTREALLRTETDATSTASDKLRCQEKGLNSMDWARCIRLLAASMPPLMHMRSSDYQQTMADIDVLKHRLFSSSDLGDGKFYQKELVRFLQRYCPEAKHVIKRLSFSEAFLINALATLEMLRASCGSISTITHYQHYELREFDASKDIRKIVKHVTKAATARYISALGETLPDFAASIIDKNARQLVLLYGFAIDSVRSSAKEILRNIVSSFPAFATSSTALPLLWAVINVLEVGNATEVERFCEHLRFPDAPAVATDPDSLERRNRLKDAVAFAEYWAQAARKFSPLALVEHATLFIVEEEATSGVIGSAAGSRLALRAHNMDTAPGHLNQNYAQILIKRSNAQGQVIAAFRLTPHCGVGVLLLRQLQAMVRDRLGTVTVTAKSHERLFASLVSTVHAVTKVGPCAEDEDGNDTGSEAGEGISHEEPSTRGDQAALRRLSEADTLLCTVAAFLVSARSSPSTQLELLWHLVRGPIFLFSSHYMSAAIQGWQWLLFEKPERYAVPLLVHLVEGFIWTIVQRLGLFDGTRPFQADEVESGEKTASIQCEALYPKEYNVNSPHKLLIEFLSDCYVDIRGPVSFHPSVLLLLHHLAMRVVEAPSRFSTKDSSFSEMMRCALLMSSICHNLQIVNERRLSIGSPAFVASASIGKVRQGWYKCLLQWFHKTPPSWYFTRDPSAAEEELVVLQKLIKVLDADRDALLRSTHGFLDFDPSKINACTAAKFTLMGSSVRHTLCDMLSDDSVKAEGVIQGVITSERNRLLDLIALMRLLVEHERTRLAVWLRPRVGAGARLGKGSLNDLSEAVWRRHCEAAARNNPAVLLALVARFPSPHLLGSATRHVTTNPEAYCHLPEAVDLYLNEEVLRSGYPALGLFTNCTIVQALCFLDKSYTTRYPQISAYALRSLLSQKSESLIFYLPQIVQLLSGDASGGIAVFLRKMCEKSDMFTHQLLWSLRTEGEGGAEMARRCAQLASDVEEGLVAKRRSFHYGEFSFIEKIISVSGEMRSFEKALRKEKLLLRLHDAEFHEPVERQHLYLPTDTRWRIAGIIPETAAAMQSAAKCPILVQFKCIPRDPDDCEVALKKRDEKSPADTETTIKACIFKMGDDCRQDQIALQIIGLFQRIYDAIQVPSYLYPYRVVTTGRDSAVIECVPRAMSRDQIGKLVESNLAEYFVQTYGHPESVTFHRARECFIRSMASYSVASFVLNVKDRHNGNLMIDAHGHLVHIDFGFLFDFSPGGDINFESSPFKLTAEMVQLMGCPVGHGNGTVQSHSLSKALVDPEAYNLFRDLTVRCYLAVRQYARQICVLVELMLGSGLPCFKPRKTIRDLAWRLSMQMSEVEAAEFMLRLISESRGNLRTVLYDRYQNFAEGIEM